MTKNEFVAIAKDFGYCDEAIENFIALQEETGLEFEEIAIEEHIID